MRKIIIIISLLLPISGIANNTDEMGNQYYSQNIKLSSQEQQGLNIAKQWQQGDKTSKPFTASDGAVSFVYGSAQVRIVCAPLQLCDIALQPGEQVNNISVGDPRFIVEPAITGLGADQQIHLIIKPKDVGLDSSLIVSTDRRTYHFRLKSDQHQFMPYVSFTYPDETNNKLRFTQQVQTESRRNNALPETNEYLGSLTFNYRIQGNTRMKPVRVYNDGVKTIIEMPKTMSQSEAPVLLVLRERGFFQAPESVMVNYRLQGNRYIADTVFDKAILIIGTGSSQEQITITRYET